MDALPRARTALVPDLISEAISYLDTGALLVRGGGRLILSEENAAETARE
jgi:hypothetical protein